MSRKINEEEVHVTQPKFEIVDVPENKVIAYVRKNKQVIRMQIQKEFHISISGASFVLNTLCDKGVLKKSRHTVIAYGYKRPMDVFEIA